ncbi:hypothetical protein HZB02_06030 [Candidatus Woesearchaeota archaeon]|nr:hypothetical protein [Candidatus Woesearchaeota archaeon]
MLSEIQTPEIQISPQEKKAFLEQQAKLLQEIHACRKELNEMSAQREFWLTKKEEAGQKIGGLIGQVKETRKSRDVETLHVKSSKGQRTTLNSTIKTKLEELRQLQQKKKELLSKHAIKEDPAELKRKISQMEYKIETEGMSFDKEQKMMKVIKDIKRKYKEFSGVMDVEQKIQKLSQELSQLKRQADASHLQVQEHATKSQSSHEQILQTSGKIDELKQQEDQAYMKFMEFKIKAGEANSKLKETLGKLTEVNGKLQQHRAEREGDRRAREQHILEEKEKVVEEKIQKRKKLTTEDLLVFQKMELDKRAQS